MLDAAAGQDAAALKDQAHVGDSLATAAAAAGPAAQGDVHAAAADSLGAGHLEEPHPLQEPPALEPAGSTVTEAKAEATARVQAQAAAPAGEVEAARPEGSPPMASYAAILQAPATQLPSSGPATQGQGFLSHLVQPHTAGGRGTAQPKGQPAHAAARPGTAQPSAAASEAGPLQQALQRQLQLSAADVLAHVTACPDSSSLWLAALPALAASLGLRSFSFLHRISQIQLARWQTGAGRSFPAASSYVLKAGPHALNLQKYELVAAMRPLLRMLLDMAPGVAGVLHLCRLRPMVVGHGEALPARVEDAATRSLQVSCHRTSCLLSTPQAGSRYQSLYVRLHACQSLLWAAPGHPLEHQAVHMCMPVPACIACRYQPALHVGTSLHCMPVVHAALVLRAS